MLSTLFVTVGLLTIVSCSECYEASCGREYDPRGPLVRCSNLPIDFLECDDPYDPINETKLGNHTYCEGNNDTVIFRAH
jgi:hypothetical protein